MTKDKKRVQWYNDLTLEAFYDSVANYKARVKLPHHDVVYVRAALRERICDAEDRLCLTFFVYEDGTFKCSNCGSSYVFNE
mgnify:CR=1 FL=1